MPVYATPLVGVLSTGSELVEPRASELPYGKIRDSNRVMLTAALRAFGAQVVDLGTNKRLISRERFLKLAFSFRDSRG